MCQSFVDIVHVCRITEGKVRLSLIIAFIQYLMLPIYISEIKVIQRFKGNYENYARLVLFINTWLP